jgi:hypothetical protein
MLILFVNIFHGDDGINVFCGGVEETILVQMNIIECIFIYECLP